MTDDLVWIVECPSTYYAPEPIAWCTTAERAREFAADYWRTAPNYLRRTNIRIAAWGMDVRAWGDDATTDPDAFYFKGDAEEARADGWLGPDGDVLPIEASTPP